MLVTIAGPDFTPEEREAMAHIARIIKAKGHKTDDYLQTSDAFQKVERCDALVANINGRVPDEGTAFMISLAWIYGKAIVIYKNDCRSVFHGQDNSMLRGLSAFKTVNQIEKIPRALEKEVRRVQAAGDAKPGIPVAEQSEKQAVYCSGPLFCPEELDLMGRIAKCVEDEGYEAFLPQRDGVEAFVMNQVNSAFANAFIFRPIQKLINKAIFALDVFQIVVRCGPFVFNMNGRVPDEGAVVECAIAWTCGKPIVIYKNDGRSLSYGLDAPILAAVAARFPTVANIEEIPRALKQAEEQVLLSPPSSFGIEELSPGVVKALKWGRRVWRLVRMFSFLKPKNKMIKS